MKTRWKIALGLLGAYLLVMAIAVMTSSDSPKAPPAPAPVDSLLLAKSESIITECQRARLIGDVTYSKMCTVKVRPLFYSIGFDAKTGLARAVIYAARGHGIDTSGIRFRDSRTNREVGSFDAFSNQLDWSGD